MLEDLIAKLDSVGVTFELARVNVDLDDALKRMGVESMIGPDRIHRSVHTGVQSFLARAS